MMDQGRPVVALLLAGLVVPPCLGDVLVIGPSKDNTLYEDKSGFTSNGAGQHVFSGRVATFGGGARRRPVMAFDIAGSIPAGSTIEDVQLTLNMSKTRFGSGPRMINLHALLVDWGEGTSNAPLNEGQGTTATAGDATWLHTFFNASFWAAVGGDFSATSSGAVSVDTVGSYTWGSTAAMVADVQSWLNDPASNFGWILIGDETVQGTAKRFDSREHPSAAVRPKLQITFTAPAVSGACCDETTGDCTPDVTASECSAGGGRFDGDGSVCEAIPCDALGACCDDATGNCVEGQTQLDCENAGSRFGGGGSTCGTITPACLGPIGGACCVELRGECLSGLFEDECNAEGGRFAGEGSTCETIDPPCDPVLSIGLELLAGSTSGAARGTTLNSPLRVTHAGDGSGRLFIVDQTGQIYVVKNGVPLATPFLDIASRMVTLSPGFDERGLLGLAFHPDYGTNGRFFVRYSAPGGTGDHREVLAEYSVLGDPATSDVADFDSEIILFSVDEPEFNHNGGDIAFGPDGMLYFALGDGGGANDGLNDPKLPHGPIGNGQDIDTHLGAMLRIDVDSPPDPGLAYHIPVDNPFVGGVGADEIYAYGFRNPYSFTFDDGPGGDGRLYVADVGQTLFEEISVVDASGNYGWAIREGAHCFDPNDPGTPPDFCASVGPVLGDPLLDPVMEYLQPEPCANDAGCSDLGVLCGSDGRCLNHGGISVITGPVYRGSTLPSLVGKLVFGDFDASVPGVDGALYYFDTIGFSLFQRREFNVTPADVLNGRFLKGIGEDEDGEVHICVSASSGPFGGTGAVLRVVAPLPSATGGGARYLSITPPDGPDAVGIAVTPDCPAGTLKYVGMPGPPRNTAVLVDNAAQAAFLTKAGWGGTVHVTHRDITPSGSYRVQLDVGTPGSAMLTGAATAFTQSWGDSAGVFGASGWSPPDGMNEINDVIAILQGFSNSPTAPPIFRTDMRGLVDPCTPDRQIDVVDALSAIAGFAGLEYRASLPECPEPCP